MQIFTHFVRVIRCLGVGLVCSLLLADGFFVPPVQANDGTLVWARAMGGIDDDEYGSDVIVDSDGNVYTIGAFYDTIDFDPGPSTTTRTPKGGADIFVSKLDSNGNFIWVKQLGGTLDEYAVAFTLDASDNIHIVGTFTGIVDFDPGPEIHNLISGLGDEDVFIAKLDSNGSYVWAKRIWGFQDDSGEDISVDSYGNVYTTGIFSGTVDFDPGSAVYPLTSAGLYDVFVSKLDSSGNFVWAGKMGGVGAVSRGLAISLDGSGNVYTAGTFFGTVDFDPGSSETFTLTSEGIHDIFVCRLDTGGNFDWARGMKGDSMAFVRALTVDDAGNVYTTGDFLDSVDFDPGSGDYTLTSDGGRDIFISKLDRNGSFIWARALAGMSDKYSYDISVDASSNVYTTGRFFGTFDSDPGLGTFHLITAGQDDIFVSKLDSHGNFVWAKGLGGTSHDSGIGLFVDTSCDIYTTGYFNETADFDPGAGIFNLISEGGGDIFVSRLSGSCFSWPLFLPAIIGKALQ